MAALSSVLYARMSWMEHASDRPMVHDLSWSKEALTDERFAVSAQLSAGVVRSRIWLLGIPPVSFFEHGLTARL